MGKLKNYDCHKQKYYVPQNKPSWSVLNLKQAAKKIDKEKSASKKQALGKKKKVAQKLANRKGGRGLRNPANPEHKKILAKVRRVDGRLEPRLDARKESTTSQMNRLESNRQPPPAAHRFREPPSSADRSPRVLSSSASIYRRRRVPPPPPPARSQSKQLKKSKRSGRVSGRNN
jgi:hypothetical protein